MSYKSFSATPRLVKDLKGKEVDLSQATSLLIKDIKTLSALVEYQIHADSFNIKDEVKNLREEKPTLKASKVGELLEYKLRDTPRPYGRGFLSPSNIINS